MVLVAFLFVVSTIRYLIKKIHSCYNYLCSRSESFICRRVCLFLLLDKVSDYFNLASVSLMRRIASTMFSSEVA